MASKAKKAIKVPGLPQKRLSTNLVQHGNFDLIFACTVLLLFCFGIIMMYSASYAYSASNKSGANALFISQLKNGILGLVLMAIISKIDYRILNGRFAFFAYGATVVVLLLTLALNIGKDEKRWIEIGSRQIQPSEFAKFTLILVLAYMMCILQKALRAPDGKTAKFTPQTDGLTSIETWFYGKARTPFTACALLAVVICSYCGLIFLESHYSCTILMFCIGVCMMWLSGTKKKYFGFLALGIAALVAFVLVFPESLEKLGGFGASRIMAWLDKGNPAYVDDRYQTVNGLYAIGSGGLFGVGLGNSKQKQLYIPEPQNDFIFPVICEELGFIGACLVLLLFAALICRGFIVARKCRDFFGSLLVMGIMIQIALQVIINVCVVTDIFPNTGIALPFFSYGGTALLVLLCEMGVVLSVSRNSSMEKE